MKESIIEIERRRKVLGDVIRLHSQSINNLTDEIKLCTESIKWAMDELRELEEEKEEGNETEG